MDWEWGSSNGPVSSGSGRLTRNFCRGSAGLISSSYYSWMSLGPEVLFSVFVRSPERVAAGLGFYSCFLFLIFLFWCTAVASPPPFVISLGFVFPAGRRGPLSKKWRLRRHQTCFLLPPLPLHYAAAADGHLLQRGPCRTCSGRHPEIMPIETFVWLCQNIGCCFSSPFVLWIWR